jgi:hypothetical protein
VTAPAKPRPAVVAAAVVLVVLVCGTGAISLLSQVVSGTVERASTFTPAAGRFVVDTDTGDVALSPSADGQVHLRTVVRHGLGAPELIEESTPAGLRLDVDCNDGIATRCDVQYTVEIPPTFEVVIGGSVGDVTASGLGGPLTVDRLSGDIALFDLTGPLDLRTRTGEITADDLRTEVLRAETDTRRRDLPSLRLRVRPARRGSPRAAGAAGAPARRPPRAPRPPAGTGAS